MVDAGADMFVGHGPHVLRGIEIYKGCLLYTSDAADERSSVDLGGRRIITKKPDDDDMRTGAINRYRNRE